MKGLARVTAGAAAAAALAACGGDDGGPDPDGPFAASVDTVRIEIDFETGEAPYTGPILGFGDTFDVAVANVGRLFAGTRAVELPTTTAQMQDVGAIDDDEHTTSDLLALAEQHRDLADDIAGGVKTYYVVFVGGVFADGDGPRPGVLGVSIGDTGVIAMFKDVIESTDVPALPNVVRFVEQSTLVHELAHAIGLVDNGVPMAADHKDDAHGAHCDADSCVMYWLNEGASDAATFAGQYVTSGDAILFDDACLADVDALTGGP